MPEAYSVKLTVSLTVTVYLTKTEKRTTKSINSSHAIAFKKRYYICPKNLDFSERDDVIRKIKKVLILKLKGIFSETTFLCVFMYKLQLCRIILTSFRYLV